MRPKRLIVFGTVAAAALPLTGAGAPSTAGGVAPFKIVQHIPLEAGAPIESAAIDSDAREVWLARGDSLVVVNADSGQKIGTVKVGGRISAVALAPDLERVLATDMTGGKLAIVDAKSRKLVRTVGVGKSPSTVAYYPPLKRAFVGDRTAGSITAIDLTSGKAAGSLRLTDGVGQLAANTYGQVFAATPQGNRVHYIDAAKVADQGAAQAGSGSRCGGVAIDYSARRVFVSCANGRVAVIDTDVGMTIKDVAGPAVVTNTAAAPFAFAPIAGWRGGAFFVGEDGTLSSVRMISPVKYAAGPSLALPAGARSVVIDTKQKRLLSAVPTGSGWELVAIAN